MKGQRLRDYWYNIYRKALKQFGIVIKELKKPNKRSLEKVRKQAKRARKEYEKEHQEKAPTVREAYNRQIRTEQEQADFREQPRDENMRTEIATNMYDSDIEVVYTFIDKLQTVYNRSMNEIDRTRENTTHDEGFQGSIMYEVLGLIQHYYTMINEILQDFLSLSEPELHEVANKLTASNELEYTWAAEFMQPSDIEVNFEDTYITLKAIWDSVQPKG
jgi:hypothetical protein